MVSLAAAGKAAVVPTVGTAAAVKAAATTAGKATAVKATAVKAAAVPATAAVEAAAHSGAAQTVARQAAAVDAKTGSATAIDRDEVCWGWDTGELLDMEVVYQHTIADEMFRRI